MALLKIPSSLEDLAIPAVCTLIFFLSYTSQILFHYLEPGPLLWEETLWFNGFVLCIWWTYDRACTVDPAPRGWVNRVVGQVLEQETECANTGVEEKIGSEESSSEEVEEEEEVKIPKGMRWCKKCKAIKPPRAHHCKKCSRCIPKMDHHCPWTSNCVSSTTFPHFLRFVFYALLSICILERHLWVRLHILWDQRSLPSYLGPSFFALFHLLVLTATNTMILIALLLLFIHATHSLCTNTTQIEGWEVDRHAALLSRAKRNGGWITTNSGVKVRIVSQEFPYDIGIWKNLVAGMGSSNPIFWFMPFGPMPKIEAGMWENNGFEDEGTMWPPLDPDKMSSNSRRSVDGRGFLEMDTREEEKEAFKRRQEEDFKARGGVYTFEGVEYRSTSNMFADEEDDDDELETRVDGDVKGGWTNSEGERLRDFGVDEEGEDEDDIPLGELLRRRKARAYES
ncbi:hypothetical protein HYALB_00011743 [Hymenoscyphus albidus]|uniref:Palmitoyltransferase PFA4 n=1 Tax=Hymenoscyphus albidus TaxID=595503 RepID=A0A9N9LQB8_9HELO|nr:hypothetical protein HYALB_00011743 [Hymenoscyphus albidus]